jgi:hypothetical protein
MHQNSVHLTIGHQVVTGASPSRGPAGRWPRRARGTQVVVLRKRLVNPPADLGRRASQDVYGAAGRTHRPLPTRALGQDMHSRCIRGRDRAGGGRDGVPRACRLGRRARVSDDVGHGQPPRGWSRARSGAPPPPGPDFSVNEHRSRWTVTRDVSSKVTTAAVVGGERCAPCPSDRMGARRVLSRIPGPPALVVS